MKRLSICVLIAAMLASPALLVTSFALDPGNTVLLRCTRSWSGRWSVRQVDGAGLGMPDLPRSCADALAVLLVGEDDSIGLVASTIGERGCFEAVPSGLTGVLYIVTTDCAGSIRR